MRQRLISAAVLVPVVVIVFLAGQPWLTLGIALIAAVAAYEASGLVTAAGLSSDRWFAVAGAVVANIGISFVVHLGFGPWLPPHLSLLGAALSFVAIVVICAAIVALRRGEPRAGFANWAGNTFAVLYPSLLAFTTGVLLIGPEIPDALLFEAIDGGRLWLLILILTVWSLDTFAYVAGRFHGRGRFMNHISPNKTWSGVIGGTAAALVVCTYLSWAAGLQPIAGIALGVAIVVTAQAGDLAESMLKRAARTKDSGTIIPGHGGILDRVDSFLFAAPVMFVFLVWLRQSLFL